MLACYSLASGGRDKDRERERGTSLHATAQHLGARDKDTESERDMLGCYSIAARG